MVDVALRFWNKPVEWMRRLTLMTHRWGGQCWVSSCAARNSAVPLNQVPPPSAGESARGFYRNLVDRAQINSVAFDEDEKATVSEWLGLVREADDGLSRQPSEPSRAA